MTRKSIKLLRKAIEKRFEKNKWLKFCKQHNPALYHKEIDRVLFAEHLDYTKIKNNKFGGRKIKSKDRGNIFYGS